MAKALNVRSGSPWLGQFGGKAGHGRGVSITLAAWLLGYPGLVCISF